MLYRAERTGMALSLLIVSALVLGGFLAFALAIAPPVRAACDMPSGTLNGWVINTPQVCSGVVYTVDGSIYINSPGSLTLTNGGIIFSEDTTHQYQLVVNGSASLTLDNSYVTTQTNMVRPWLALTANIAGSLILRNQAALEFPGALNLNAGSVLNLTDSKITNGVGTEFTGGWGSSANITLTGANAYLFGSRIENLFPGVDMAVTSASNVFAYDTYLNVGFTTVDDQMSLTGGSKAYLYNVTAVPYTGTATQSAFLVDGTSNVYLLRWLHATAVDATDVPVPGATITSTRSPGTQVAQYPDNGLSTTPSSTTRWYLASVLGLRNPSYSVTDSNGKALIPLWSDTISQASLPNAVSFGNYQESATDPGYPTATAGVSFSPYPSMTAASNNANLTIAFSSSIICTSPVTTWSGTVSLTGPVAVSGTLEIAGATTITSGSLYIGQQANACGYVKIDSGASLTLVGSSVSSNYPLVIDVTNGGTFTARQGSSLDLTQAGLPGLLRSEGTAAVTVTDATVAGNVSLNGASATLLRDVIEGPSLAISTTTTTKLYDASLPGVTKVALGSAPGLGTLAFDIRNVTFNQVQTSQLVFGNNQKVQLTNVTLYDPNGTWYLSMVTGNAVVSRYWWLTVDDVDGTGTLLAQANATIYLWRIDPVTARTVAVPTAQAGDVFYTSSTSNPFVAPAGFILYRAFQGTWTASGQFLNNTYVANGSASPQGSVYNSDASAQSVVSGNTVMQLSFTSLTPDLSVTLLTVTGGNGNSPSQPINTMVTLVATIHNAGQIDVKNVDVAFFSVNVDLNGDGILDQAPNAYRQSAFINETTVAVVPKAGNAVVSVGWVPQGSFASSVPVSVVVDPDNAIRETNELNNILVQTVQLFVWPDLSVTSADVFAPTDPVVNNPAAIQVTVHNVGTNSATTAKATLFEGGVAVSQPVFFNVGLGAQSVQTLVWHPTSVGVHTLEVLVDTKNDTAGNRDYIFGNNIAFASFTVHTQPDLSLVASDYSSVTTEQDAPFSFNVIVHNIGQTAVVNTSVGAYLDGNRSASLGTALGISVLANSQVTVRLDASGIHTPGTHSVELIVDPTNLIIEGDETNNFANLTVYVSPPAGQAYIGAPDQDQVFQPGVTISAFGFVRDNAGTGIPNIPVWVTITQSGNVLVNVSATTDPNGKWTANLPLSGMADGTYQVNVISSQPGIKSASYSIAVRSNVPFLNQPVPIIGLQWWIFLIILAAAAAALVGVTLYFKVYGLGKMVECGECGAFIPEDATTCPKCGVEFEKDMAKCSNCQAWIPVDVKQCPECGVEFATGQVEMADYQEKMRLQYDEVVMKFKDEAQRQLGRQLSDREFQDWWRKQPTFVTFEDWLREEEEMRKMGSKPCPVCGTLNSVTATVCHKCGSLMKDSHPPAGGAGGAGGAVAGAPVARRPAPIPPTQPMGGTQPPAGGPLAAPGGTETIPRRVIRKPVATQPVLQKKVIKRPSAEGESSEGGEQQSGDQQSGDEL